MGMRRIRMRPFKMKSRSIEKLILKECSKCKIKKPLDDFYRRKSSKDGRQSVCKECTKLYRKEKK